MMLFPISVVGDADPASPNSAYEFGVDADANLLNG
jgi:hypothetical protein